MYQYHNYAYSAGVPGDQNVAAYCTRQSAAAAASRSLSPSTTLPADDAGPRRITNEAKRDLSTLTSPSSRRPTPGGAPTYHDRSSADAVPPAPTVAATGAPPATYLRSPPPPPASSFGGGMQLYSTPFDRVAVRVDADDDDVRDQQQQQQHARSLSAPAAPRRRPAAVTDHHRHGPLDVERRLLPSPPPPPSTSTPTRRDSSTGATVRCRRTFPDVEPVSYTHLTLPTILRV